MKQTIKKLAITFGNKVLAALVSTVAMLIGEAILSLFGKGFTKFRANREARKADTTEAATELDNAEIPETELTETVIPEETDADVTDND